MEAEHGQRLSGSALGEVQLGQACACVGGPRVDADRVPVRLDRGIEVAELLGCDRRVVAGKRVVRPESEGRVEILPGVGVSSLLLRDPRTEALLR